MDINEIKELVELIQASGIEEFEMEKSGVRLRIRNSRNLHLTGSTVEMAHALAAPAQPIKEVAPVEEEQEDLYIFKAPIVGTFYITPKPDADPFVSVGSRISKSQVICIIEAMKIFNQIESDVSGEVVEMLVENGQPVEYGEPLFKIRQS